ARAQERTRQTLAVAYRHREEDVDGGTATHATERHEGVALGAGGEGLRDGFADQMRDGDAAAARPEPGEVRVERGGVDVEPAVDGGVAFALPGGGRDAAPARRVGFGGELHVD